MERLPEYAQFDVDPEVAGGQRVHLRQRVNYEQGWPQEVLLRLTDDKCVGQLLQRQFSWVSACIVLVSVAGCSAGDVPADEAVASNDAIGLSREAQMADIAEMYSLPTDVLPQDVPLIRYIMPSEYFDVHAGCMEEEGFPSERQGESLMFDPGEDQQLAFRIADYVCTGKYPIDLSFTTPLTTEQWTQVYEHLVAETVPCIRALGYDVADPPTIETYLQSSPQDRWNPVGEVEQQVVEDAMANGRWDSFDEFVQTCPPSPPAEELRGDGG